VGLINVCGRYGCAKLFKASHAAIKQLVTGAEYTYFQDYQLISKLLVEPTSITSENMNKQTSWMWLCGAACSASAGKPYSATLSNCSEGNVSAHLCFTAAQEQLKCRHHQRGMPQAPMTGQLLPLAKSGFVIYIV
jgi:hypothetical protein